MSDAFPSTKHETNTHWMKLDRDPVLWDNFITMRVAEIMGRRPVNITIKWRAKNEDGYGVGSVFVVSKNDSKNMFRIPIVMKDFRLAPLDIIMTETRKYPLNKDNLDALLRSGNLAKGVAPDSVTVDGRYGVPVTEIAGDGESMREKFSMLAHISGYVRQTDIDYVQSKAASMGHEIVQAIEKLVPEQSAPTIKKIEVISKGGPGEFTVMASPESGFSPSVGTMNGEQLRKVLEVQVGTPAVTDAVIQAVEATGEDGAIVPWPKEDDGVELSFDSSVDGKKGLGFYKGRSSVDGHEVKGIYVPTVISMFGKPRSEGVFISDEGGGLQGSDFQGEPTLDNVRLHQTSYPEAGNSGFLVFSSNGNLLAMGPIQFLSRQERDDDGIRKYTVMDEQARVVEFLWSRHVKNIAVEDNKITVPKNKTVTFYRLDKQFKVIQNQKDASDKVKVLIDQGKYYIRGLQDTLDELKTAEAKFVLASHGMGIEKISQAFDMLDKYRHIYISGLKKSSSIEKAAMALPFDLSKYDFVKMAATINNVETDVNQKLAAIFDKIDTVDTVLSLNFLNNANVKKFISALPSLIETREELLGLLLASRLGETEIPEDSVLQSVDALNEVIDGLKRLKFKSNATY